MDRKILKRNSKYTRFYKIWHVFHILCHMTYAYIIWHAINVWNSFLTYVESHISVTGLLRDEIEKDAEKAFQSYMGIVASPPNNTDDFSMKVNEYMQQPPFNFPNPVKGLGGIKKVKFNNDKEFYFHYNNKYISFYIYKIRYFALRCIVWICFSLNYRINVVYLFYTWNIKCSVICY